MFVRFLFSWFTRLLFSGHESPFAIKMNHLRESAVEDGFPSDFDQLPFIEPLSPETQCQFLLKRIRKDSSSSSNNTNTSGHSISTTKLVVGEMRLTVTNIGVAFDWFSR